MYPHQCRSNYVLFGLIAYHPHVDTQAPHMFGQHCWPPVFE